jgi:hypothetical protein
VPSKQLEDRCRWTANYITYQLETLPADTNTTNDTRHSASFRTRDDAIIDDSSTTTEPPPDNDEPVKTAATPFTHKRIYALALKECPADVTDFLVTMKSFFTKPINLQRQSPALLLTTIAKVEERILYK